MGVPAFWWTLVVDCHKSADRSPPVRRIPEDVEPDLEGDLSLVDRNAIVYDGS